MENVSIVGLDIAKNSFRAHGAAEDGMVAALPRRHRDVPNSWNLTPRKGEDGK